MKYKNILIKYMQEIDFPLLDFFCLKQKNVCIFLKSGDRCFLIFCLL